MKIIETEISGLYQISNFVRHDDRGSFTKNYNKDAFKSILGNQSFSETYFSTSHKNVLRGMHFQNPPHDHNKLVTVNQGLILDVVLDMRKHSTTYGKCFSTKLDCKVSLLIPSGMAHGFLSLADNTIVSYQTSTVYNADADEGVLFSSIDFNWPDSKDLIISERDRSFSNFSEYKNLFV